MKEFIYRRTIVWMMMAAAFAGCSDSPVEPHEPAPALPPAPPPPPQPPPPPLPDPFDGGNLGIYGRVTPSSWSGTQHYILKDSTHFALIFVSAITADTFVLDGRYTNMEGTLAMAFNLTADWRATAILHKDTLTVSYNEAMIWADFEDGKFVRLP